MASIPKFDDPARVSDYGTLPGEHDWTFKQQRQYEARVKQLAQTYTHGARMQIEAVIDGRADECEVMTYEGVRRVNAGDLLEMLIDAAYGADMEPLRLFSTVIPSLDIKTKAIEALAQEVGESKARAQVDQENAAWGVE